MAQRARLPLRQNLPSRQTSSAFARNRLATLQAGSAFARVDFAIQHVGSAFRRAERQRLASGVFALFN